MLAQCIGRQREGWLRATHKKIADKLGVERSNVTRALGRLEGWHMLQRVDTGLIFVNPLLGFEGNGDVQHEVLEALRRGAPEGAFPELKAPPAPRSVQLEPHATMESGSTSRAALPPSISQVPRALAVSCRRPDPSE
ncbi:hypothetical protein GCM10027073_61720 [Streptomyces chlorus]|uniref:Replication/maintenance protein RepL n=1 Tax=Streptomyces chlorus TaxID=887452 RepID=A0ABW1E6Y0_9ACTN